MKGFGTDEKALVRHLADKDPLQINVLREVYHQRFKRHLLNDVQSETSSWFMEGLCAIIRGPLLQDVVALHSAISGPGTKEKILNDILLGRSNADMRAIKDLYHKTYHKSLESDIRGDLSMKTERHFMMVLAANRNEESTPVIPQQIDQDVMELYKATEGKTGTDELLVCSILTQRSDAQIGAIAYTYKQKFTRDLETVIKKVRPSPTFHSRSIELTLDDRNSLDTWNSRSCTNCAPVLTRRCATRSSSKTPWMAWAPKTICWSSEWCACTGIATICSRLKGPTSIVSTKALCPV